MTGESDMTASSSSNERHTSPDFVRRVGKLRSSWVTRLKNAALRSFTLIALVVSVGVFPAHAQSTDAPVVITPPTIKMVDENHVSILSGKAEFSVPAVRLGDVAFTLFTYDGAHFTHGGLVDNNDGQVVGCSGSFGNGAVTTPQCSVSSSAEGVQAQFGDQRETFYFESSGPPYMPQNSDGSSFVDNINTNGTCTWTQRDGTKVVYAGFHQASGSQICLSYNILSVTYPDGRILTYYYYGSFNQTGPTPILSVVSNTGYMLKYNYSGTPVFSLETSVTAINRAFEACDPVAVTCTLQNSWPTATLTFQDKPVSPCDGFAYPQPGCDHQIFTVQDAAHRNYVFELDSAARVVSYQPPDATSPISRISFCSVMSDGSSNCYPAPTPGGWDPRPLYTDTVTSVARNGQTWTYSSEFSTGGPPGHGDWAHTAFSPPSLNTSQHATGNATPGSESLEGPIDSINLSDGTVVNYQRSTQNTLQSVQTPAGLLKYYYFDVRSNLTKVAITPIGGGTQIVETATYPEAGAAQCADIVTCNKPISSTDANGNETDFTYDPTFGGMLTETEPAGPNGVRPEILRAYSQHHASYLNSSGTLTTDPNGVWLLDSETICRTGAVSGSGCANPSDAVVTSYDYGDNSGPNNLILRGKTVTGDGQTLRTCFAHDKQGNKIWETSPNANPASCPNY